MKIEKFKNNLIAFDFDSESANATDLLKTYNDNRLDKQKEKSMGDFLRLKSTKEYKDYLESKVGNPVLTVKHGGSGHGTWMHRKLIYDFAAWLSVEFKDYIYEVFDNHMKEQLREYDKKFVEQQRFLDYYNDRDDIADLYPKRR